MHIAMARALRLITFDVTDTLLKFRIPVAVHYAECARKFNIHVDTDVVLQNFKLEVERLSKQHPNFGRSTGLGWKQWWTDVVVNAYLPAAPNAGRALLTELAEHLIEEFKTDRCWVLANGGLDLLKFLKEKQLLLGVISNYDERLEMVLRSLEIDSYFDVTVSSYRAGAMKPDKKIFDFVLKEVEQYSLSPENCLHIGDSVQFDYIGAKNAGWNAFHLGPLSEEFKKVVEPSHIFKNLAQLQSYFKTEL